MALWLSRIACSNDCSVLWTACGLRKISVDAAQTMTRRAHLFLRLNSAISAMGGVRLSVRRPRRMVAICVRLPTGSARPCLTASTPAMKVVLTAPRPTSSTPSLPLAGSMLAFFSTDNVRSSSKLFEKDSGRRRPRLVISCAKQSPDCSLRKKGEKGKRGRGEKGGGMLGDRLFLILPLPLFALSPFNLSPCLRNYFLPLRVICSLSASATAESKP